MIFNTGWFLAFFLVFYALFWLMPGPRVRFYFTLAASAIFHYHFAGPAGITPILLMAVATFLFALALPRARAGATRRRLFFLALCVPVLALLAYKYRALLLSPFSGLGGGLGEWFTARAIQPALPLAISFFTFEFVHYLTDVYHGSKPVKDPLKFSLFCIFFPSIVSGPIKRYQPFLAQMEGGLARPLPSMALQGFFQVALGYFKKLVVADNAALVIQLLEKNTDGSPGAVAALMVLLSIRILFDFSGYSDIAIGLGRMVGLELPANFNYPYLARNISEFWQRWHMSLSSWIRDYIYIPLGGSRHGLGRKFANLLFTMFLCGLWHGPSWHFGFWGLYQGLGLAVHGAWEKSSWGLALAKRPFSRWAGMALNNLFVAYGWLMFFYPMKDVGRYTRTLLGF